MNMPVNLISEYKSLNDCLIATPLVVTTSKSGL